MRVPSAHRVGIHLRSDVLFVVDMKPTNDHPDESRGGINPPPGHRLSWYDSYTREKRLHLFYLHLSR